MPKSKKSAIGSKIRTDRCFNPFGLFRHRKLENVRQVLKQHLEILNLPVTDESLQQKICNTCRHKVSELHKDREKKVNFTVDNT